MVGKRNQPPAEPVADQAELQNQPGDRELLGTETEPVAEGEAAKTDRYEVPAGQVVYRGSFSAREITLQDWQKAGVQDQPGVRWDRKNNYSLPKEGFSEAALRLLAHDSDIRIGE